MRSIAMLAFLWSTAAYANQPACNAPMSEPIAYVTLPGHPFGVVSSADGCWLFVSLNSSSPRSKNGIGVLRRSRGGIKLERMIPVEAEPTGMTLTHDGKLLIVADGDYVVFMDVHRMSIGKGDPILGYFKDADNAGRIYVNATADDGFLFVSDEYARTVTVINLRRARSEGFKETAIIGKIPVGDKPIALTFSPDERWLYTTSERVPDSLNWPTLCKPERDPTAKQRFPQGAIYVVDVAKAKTDPAHAVAATVAAGCSPVRLAITPTGERAFVTARNSNAVLAFDATKLVSDPTHARIGEVPVGSSPVGIVVIDRGLKVIATNSNRFAREQKTRQELSVIDTLRMNEGKGAVSSIPAGLFPRELSLSPDQLTLFVANYFSDELEVVDLRRLK